MDGTISLGIYDSHGKLVRVLHKAATADEFVAALDGFITHWDGLDDNGKPMPPGKYDARGYMVGAVKVSPLKEDAVMHPIEASAWKKAIASATPFATMHTEIEASLGLVFPNGKPFVHQDKIHVRLVDNPLDRDRAGAADLSVRLGLDGTWLTLADGLPLLQIDKWPGDGADGEDFTDIGQPAPGEPLMVFTMVNAVETSAYAITNVSDMMAFDCGDFDFAGVGKW